PRRRTGRSPLASIVAASRSTFGTSQAVDSSFHLPILYKLYLIVWPRSRRCQRRRHPVEGSSARCAIRPRRQRNTERPGMTFELHKEAGSGPAVVFNHGTLMDYTMFDPQLAFLAANGYRAISQNSRVLLGKAERHTLEDLADDTARLGERLGLTRYVVAGMSTGAFMAVDFALKYPDRADGFILIEGQACAYSEAEQNAFDAEFERFNVDGFVSRERAEWAAPFCFGEHTYAHNRGLVDHWLDRWTTMIPSRAGWAQRT